MIHLAILCAFVLWLPILWVGFSWTTAWVIVSVAALTYGILTAGLHYYAKKHDDWYTRGKE